MGFKPAVKEVGRAKIGVFGPTGSGKTTLETMISIYLSKTYHGGAPVAYLDSEKGSDFMIPIFEVEEVPLLVMKTRAFKDLRDASKNAIKEGACVVNADSISHFWSELLRTVQGDRRRLDIKLIGEAKQRWSEFTEDFDRSNIHYLVAGRLGYDWENVDVEDEDGKVKNELLKGGTKMKAEGDFGYETDLLIELGVYDDPEGADYRRLKRGNRVTKLASGQIHSALVKKCRVRELNGQMFSWPDKKAYKPGDYKKVAECFLPYFNFLNMAGEHVAFDASRNSSELVDRTNKNDYVARKRDKEIALEEIKNNLTVVWTAASGKDAAIKLEVLNLLFGTNSWTAVENMQLDPLQTAAKVTARMKQMALEKMPSNREEALSLTKTAHDEVVGRAAEQEALEVF